MKHLSLSITGFERKTKRTRKREFLDEMSLVVPWAELCLWLRRTHPSLGPKAGVPEFDTNRNKLLIHIDRAVRLPLQQAQLGVLLGFLDLECGQHIRLALSDGFVG